MKHRLTACTRTGIVALLFATLVTALLATSVAAHALLINSDPESGEMLEQTPSQVVAWFSEELDTRLSTMQVMDVKGRQVDSGDGGVDLNDPDHASMTVSLPESLPNDIYTVRWVALSAEDADIVEGEFAFIVGDGRLVDEPGLAPAGTGINRYLAVAAGVALLAVLAMIAFAFVLLKVGAS